MNEQTQRIILIMQEKKMNAAQFSEAIGIKPASLSHITSGRNNPSADVITKIVDRFEDINPGWLLTGKGTMKNGTGRPERLNEEQPPSRNDVQEVEKVKSASFPANKTDLFESDAHAGYSQQTQDANGSGYIRKPPMDAESAVRTERRLRDESRPPEAVHYAEINNKTANKEMDIYKERPVKTVEKLIIFFSDKTFETFIPERIDISK